MCFFFPRLQSVHCSNSLFRFFCNVCFLRKEIKMYLDFKENPVGPIQSVVFGGGAGVSPNVLVLLPPQSSRSSCRFCVLFLSTSFFFFFLISDHS